jgi:hypothetical protein
MATSLNQTRYFYTVELTALEEYLSRSMDRVLRLREKAMKRRDFRAAGQIGQLQRSVDVARRRTTRLK